MVLVVLVLQMVMVVVVGMVLEESNFAKLIRINSCKYSLFGSTICAELSLTLSNFRDDNSNYLNKLLTETHKTRKPEPSGMKCGKTKIFLHLFIINAS